MSATPAENDPSKLKALIDENLKRVYGDALSEAIPDRFTELLKELKSKEDKK